VMVIGWVVMGLGWVGLGLDLSLAKVSSGTA